MMTEIFQENIKSVDWKDVIQDEETIYTKVTVRATKI